MPDHGWMEPIVERVVTRVLESHTVQLRTEIVRRVMEEIAADPAAATALKGPAPGLNSAELAGAVTEIQVGTSQKEILRALLDSCTRYASRVALFVVKGGQATGWQGRGFAHNDGVKDFALEASAAAVARAIGDHVVVAARPQEVDGRFLSQFGTPNGEVRLLPLLLKEKVAALVYADAGTTADGHLDGGALELLVLATSAWLEVNSLRKLTKDHAPEPGTERAESRPAPVQAVTSFSDPFAGHAPSHAKAAAASAKAGPASSAATLSITESPSAATEPLPEIQAAPVPVSETPSVPAGSAEDQDVHRKAQRFARLLVDEIKLYNQAKVAEGRQHKNLYDRLKEAIEKSRNTYQKRYGNTVAASGDYFQHELVRSLAEDDVSIMGANFRH